MNDRVHRELYQMNSNVYAARVDEGMDGMFTRRDVTRGDILCIAIRNATAERRSRPARYAVPDAHDATAAAG
jgi:hypothetical protein